MSYQVHLLADTMPLTSPAEYQELLSNIKVMGLLEPITRYQDKVLDGRNRLRACEEANIEPKFLDYTGDDPAAFVFAKNLKRRHLNQTQTVLALLRMQQLVSTLQDEAHERRLRHLQKGNPSSTPSCEANGDEENAEGQERETSSAPDAEPAQKDNKHARTTAAKLGEQVSVSEKTIERFKYVLDHGTEEDVQAIASGKMLGNSKAKETRQRRKDTKKSATKPKSKAGKRQRPETEAPLTAAEWTKLVRLLEQTLLLDPAKATAGEARGQVARFQRALESKDLTPKAKKDMKRALEGLRQRCESVLQRLK
jgi:hypothetical protein